MARHYPEAEPEEESPCVKCGACCANYRVSFYWSEVDAHPSGTVPVALTVPVSLYHAAMRGTEGARPRCAALEGDIGKSVRCGIYDVRPSPCRGFVAGDERCDEARIAHGLVPLGMAPAPGE